MFIIKFCWWLDSSHGPLLLEATSLPTEPQPLQYPRSIPFALGSFLWVPPSLILFLSWWLPYPVQWIPLEWSSSDELRNYFTSSEQASETPTLLPTILAHKLLPNIFVIVWAFSIRLFFVGALCTLMCRLPPYLSLSTCLCVCVCWCLFTYIGKVVVSVFPPCNNNDDDDDDCSCSLTQLETCVYKHVCEIERERGYV